MTLTPFAKWLGGKRNIAQYLIDTFPEEYGAYYEPFIGAGAVMITALPHKIVINDLNTDLIDTYKILAANDDELKNLIEKLNEHQALHNEERYYEVRAQDRESAYSSFARVDRVARFLYLNKAGFNGLFRLNSKGQFNVPSGKRTNIDFNIPNLKSLAQAFSECDMTILNGSYVDALVNAQAGDMVYLDPPYDPISQTASFTTYAAGGFSRANQKELYETAKHLVSKGVHVTASNSGTDFIKELWSSDEFFVIHDLNVERRIGAYHKEASRKVGEVVMVSK